MTAEQKGVLPMANRNATELSRPSPSLGTLVLDNVPAYHGPAIFHWTLTKRPWSGTLGVFASQNGVFVYIAELPIAGELSGSGQVIIESEVSSAMPGKIDYSKPSDCQAFMWDERLVKQGKPPAISNQVFFTIPAEP